jgi:4-hydroxy-tetrahydrodipicolinate synthase
VTDFGAILTAMVTPFDSDGNVDESATAQLLDHLFSSGSDGVVVCGTTGEAATLDDREHLAVIDFVVTHTRREHPGKSVVAGVGSNDTRHAVQLTEAASALGPDGLLSVNPYYNRPSRAGVMAHYREVVRATDLPIVLYNIPQRTGADLSNDLLAELAQLENISAVKQANEANLAKVDGLSLYAGNDDLLAAVLDLGELGVIGTSTHIFGPLFRRMVEEPENRRAINAQLGDVYRDMAIAPAAVTNKAALHLIGLDVGGPRLPYVPLTATETAVLSGLLERHGMMTQTSAQA